MRMINDEGAVLHDTYVEKLAISLVRSSVDVSYAFITGALGFTLIVKGLHPAISRYRDQPQIQDRMQQTSEKISWKRRMIRSFLSFWKFMTSIFVSNGTGIPLLHCLWSGGIIGLGLWIIIQPLLSQLSEMIRKEMVIYHVKWVLKNSAEKDLIINRFVTFLVTVSPIEKVVTNYTWLIEFWSS